MIDKLKVLDCELVFEEERNLLRNLSIHHCNVRFARAGGSTQSFHLVPNETKTISRTDISFTGNEGIRFKVEEYLCFTESEWRAINVAIPSGKAKFLLSGFKSIQDSWRKLLREDFIDFHVT